MIYSTVTEETREICTLCGGRGNEFNNYGTTSGLSTCRSCHGTGQIVVKTVIRTQEIDIDSLVDALAKYIQLNKGKRSVSLHEVFGLKEAQ